MTKYRTEYKAVLHEHDFYRCPSCGEETEHYNHLYHPDAETGGFCPVCNDDVDLYETYTVKAVVYARSKEEAVEIAYDMGDFDVIDGSINLEERIK